MWSILGRYIRSRKYFGQVVRGQSSGSDAVVGLAKTFKAVYEVEEDPKENARQAK